MKYPELWQEHSWSFQNEGPHTHTHTVMYRIKNVQLHCFHTNSAVLFSLKQNLSCSQNWKVV